MKLADISWNAAGLLAPLLVALLTVPPLLALLGTERFGLLSLTWALTAMSGLFDLGVGRATTRMVAGQIGRAEAQFVRSTMSAAVRLALAAGCVGAGLLAASISFGLDRLIRLSSVDATELRMALWLLVPIVPLQTLIATYRGVCEGCQRFQGISLVRMALGVATFAAPLAVAYWSTHLAALAASLLLARLLACLAFARLAYSAAPRSRATHRATDLVRELVRSGSWLTVSALVSPLLVQADRFFIGAVISAAAVASYTVPFDVITQLLVGVTAVSTVAFPSIARQLQQDPTASRRLFDQWLYRVAVVMALLCLAVAWFLPTALRAWVGDALPAESVVIGRWLCLGVWINALGSMYFAWLHAHGRFRATALLHLVELPLYFLLLSYLLHEFGVTGAALAWVARVAVDSGFLAWMARPRDVLLRP